MEVFTINKVLEQVNLAIVGTSDLTPWFLKVQHELTMTAVDVVSGDDILFTIPEHTRIVCNLETATAWTQQQTCAARLAAQIPFDILYVLYTLLVEVVIKVLMFQEESFVQTVIIAICLNFALIAVTLLHFLACSIKNFSAFACPSVAAKCIAVLKA